MEFKEFLDKILGNVMSKDGLENVKQHIKQDMELSGFDYETTKVECQVLDDESNYDPRVEISNEAYSDGEVIFLDFYLDNK